MTTLTQGFDTEVLQSELPVLVDFTAAWCGPCKMIKPSIEQLATELEGVAKVVVIDVDEYGEVASRYGVMSIPTLAVFKGGREVDRIVGAHPKAAIEQFVRRHA